MTRLGRLALIAVLAGCTDSAGPEAAPQPPTEVIVTPFDVSAGSVNYRLTLTPPASGPITTYLIELGTGPGLDDLGSREVPGGATEPYEFGTPHHGPFVVRVRTKDGARLSSPSAEVAVEDVRDVVEALFLSTGPLRSPAHQPICQFTSFYPDVVEGFPRGARIAVLLSSGLAAEPRAAVERELGEFSAATGGGLARGRRDLDRSDVPRIGVSNQRVARTERDGGARRR
jgi:hypothetical protein